MGAAEKTEEDLADARREIARLVEVVGKIEGLSDAVLKLQLTVDRFVVAMERSLASNDAVQRKAERVLKGMDPEKMKAMNERLDRIYGRK